ncbi:MAG: hypothetical protein ACJ77K_09850 [Bacteroidia bacterium]
MRKTFLLFLLLPFFTNAQISGYLGKRCIVSYSNCFMYGVSGPTARSSGSGFNFTHGLGIEYQVKERISLGLNGQFVHTGVGYKYVKYNYGEHSPMILNNFAVGISLKKYGKRRIPPLGFYQKFEIFFSHYTVKYDTSFFRGKGIEHYHSNMTYSTVPTGSGEIAFNGLGGAFSIGKQRVFFHKLVLDYGVRGAILFPMIPGFNTEVEQSVCGQSGLRFLGHQMLNLKIGIGFLAF